jgi:predicted nucleotide-binding protein
VKELKECFELIGIENDELRQLDEFDNSEDEEDSIDKNIEKSDVEKIRALEDEYKQLSDNEPNSKQSIDAYHKWYNETLLYLSNTCKNNEDFSKFKNLDNSGNGHCLRDNYHQISGIYNLLLTQNNSKQYNDNMERTKVNNKVFIVHGHDNAMKSVVARFIEHLKLVPIILDEEPNKGQTIIEKIESNSDVGYAIVLLSPCDVGRSKDSEELRPRARQNVIMELGYFIGKLGRSNVCALKKNDIEIPSDALGVLYTSYSDNDEGWKMKVAKDLKCSGYNIDMNLLCFE